MYGAKIIPGKIKAVQYRGSYFESIAYFTLEEVELQKNYPRKKSSLIG